MQKLLFYNNFRMLYMPLFSQNSPTFGAKYLPRRRFLQHYYRDALYRKPPKCHRKPTDVLQWSPNLQGVKDDFEQVFATYILQFAEIERKYFVMSKKNSTFVAERRRRRNELVATTAACGIRRPLLLLLPRSHELLGRENVKWKQQNTY